MKTQILSAAAVAALLAVCTTGAMAQDATNPGPTVQPMAFTPINIPTITAPPAMDYKVLIGQPFTFMDIRQAERTGLSDRDIARIAKIADITGLPFQVIREQVLVGDSFAELSEMYGINIASIYDVDNEMQTIQDFKDATRTTGYWAMRDMSGNMNGNMSGDMTTGNG
jgi:hypothetical protein